MLTGSAAYELDAHLSEATVTGSNAHDSMLDAFQTGVAHEPTAVAVRHGGEVLTRHQLDELSDALASALLAGGVTGRERLAVHLPDVPQLVLAVLAAWKAGAVPVLLDPGCGPPKLRRLLPECGVSVLVTVDDQVAHAVVPPTGVRWVLGTTELSELIGLHGAEVPPPVDLAPGDVAAHTCSWGPGGQPTTVVHTHRDLVLAPQVPGPLGRLAAALLAPASLVLTGRVPPPGQVDSADRTGG